LPDKAIDVLDEAGSRARISTMTRPPEIKAQEAEIEEIKGKKDAPLKTRFRRRGADARPGKKRRRKNEALLKDWRTKGDEKRIKVGEEEILHVVSKWTAFRSNAWPR